MSSPKDYDKLRAENEALSHEVALMGRDLSQKMRRLNAVRERLKEIQAELKRLRES